MNRVFSLQQQRAERRGAARSVPGWSPWSDWSPCSRSCDGGAAFQLRRCEAPSGCRGDDIRHKICNMQPCPESGDFRLQQCAAFNELPYEGQLLAWTPHHEESEPCALTCRGRPRGELPRVRTLPLAAAPPHMAADAPAPAPAPLGVVDAPGAVPDPGLPLPAPLDADGDA
ncbi:uncharacterized protein GBIM_11691, partial [Gryllus bimaculatus]